MLNASVGTDVTSEYLAAGDHGRYHGILLDSGDLGALGQPVQGRRWMALATYEAPFGVRRVVVYTTRPPLTGCPDRRVDARAARSPSHAPRPAAAIFAGANCAAPVAIDDGWAYGSQAADASTKPLLVDAGGSVYAATAATPTAARCSC